MKTKVCTKCKTEKSIEDFFKDKQKSTGYRPDCKVCSIKISTACAKRNREQVNFNNLKYKSGLSKKDYLDI